MRLHATLTLALALSLAACASPGIPTPDPEPLPGPVETPFQHRITLLHTAVDVSQPVIEIGLGLIKPELVPIAEKAGVDLDAALTALHDAPNVGAQKTLLDKATAAWAVLKPVIEAAIANTSANTQLGVHVGEAAIDRELVALRGAL